MKKPLHCLFLVMIFIFTLPFSSVFAREKKEDFSGCCKAPSDVIYWCTDLPYDFNPRNLYQLQSLFGKPQNKCYANLWEELTPTIDLSNCGTGTLIRRFKVSAHYGYEYCSQTITIKGVHDYDIRFPADALTSCGVTPAAEELLTNEGACDLLAISVEDYKFSASGSECGKIFRTYRVINWCEYDGISDPVLVDRDEDCDGKAGDEDVWVLRRSDGYAFIDRDNDEDNNNPKANERLICSPKNPAGYWRSIKSSGYWVYTQHIKMNDNVPPSVTLTQPSPICSYNVNCNANINIPFSVTDICTPNDIKVKIFIDGIKIIEYAKGGNYTATGVYKLGEHSLEIHAIDGCGNSTVQKTIFKVVDCKAPAPICINGISIRLMPTPPNTDADSDGDIDPAATTIWASDLLTSSDLTDCSGIAGFAIGRIGETPNFDQKSITFTCDDEGTQYVRIYVWDNAYNPYALQPDSTRGGRNYSFCQTYVLVQNNSRCTPLPPPPPPSLPAPTVGSIAGIVQTEDEFGLEAVQLALIGPDSSLQWTSEAGDYHFDSLRLGKSYEIVPFLKGDPLEGLEVSDLVVLQEHILGNQPLPTAYRLIAADANRSGEITTADLLAFRGLMLGLLDRLPSNTNWRFIDAAYRFPNLANPWETVFPEKIKLDSIIAGSNPGNFVAIKVGDIDGSLSSQRRALKARSNAITNLEFENQTLSAGTTVSVPFVITDDIATRAAQFALYFNPNLVEMTSITYEAARAEHFNLKDAANGNIRMVWVGNKEAVNSDKKLFTLQFKVLQDTRLEEVLQLNERVLSPIAYENGEISKIVLTFTESKTTEFKLYPNRPNPFQDETLVAFQLPEAATATLKIYDINGKMIWQHQGQFTKGYQELRISSAALRTQGVLLYSLETQQHRARGKMVVMPR